MTALNKVFKSGLQSATIMSAADIVTQWLVENKEFPSEYDVKRTLRWTLAGISLHGPYFFVGFTMIDKRVGPATTMTAVAQKTALAQFILFPPYLVALFGLMGMLEQHPNIADKIRTKVPDAFISGCLYWPVVNGFNFALVPATLRVPYLAASAGLWNSYLSWENAFSSDEEM